jgi:tetraacyldisaccharide 4'-kinase
VRSLRAGASCPELMESASPGARGWLAPAGALFGAGAALRVSLYRRGLLGQARLSGPVISVGNLSVGGTGKTPVVARIAEILIGEGTSVSILSRGYGGSFRGEALLVSDGREVLASSDRAGDEPVMLARALPRAVVAVGRHRDVVGRMVEQRFGPRVHLLDDGFQHLRLARDFDLLCLDAFDLDDRPLPAGRLREFPSSVARADLVLLSRADEIPPERLERIERRLGRDRTIRLTRRVEGFVSRQGTAVDAPARAFLVSGVARPERFHADAARSVATIVGTAVFPDHHRFTPADQARLLAEARAAGADAILTTAKDAVRLPASDGIPIVVLRISALLLPEAPLRERLLALARRAA